LLEAFATRKGLATRREEETIGVDQNCNTGRGGSKTQSGKRIDPYVFLFKRRCVMKVMTKALGATIFLCLFGLLSGPAADANGATLANDIVGWWQMGEGATVSGGAWSVPDNSANSNAATQAQPKAGGITLVPGAIGGTAMSFDGAIGSALGVVGTTELANIGAGSFSVSLWMKADQTSLINDGNWHRLATKEESGGKRWTVENEFSNSRFAWFTTDSGYHYTAIDDFDASEWRHLAFVRDTATETLLVYDNGVTISTNGGPGAGVSEANGGDFGIAGLPNGEAPTTTILDDVRIYSVALSSADVAAIYNGGAGDVIPEPGTIVMLLVGLTMCGWRRCRA
jgi:hypothetical protein